MKFSISRIFLQGLTKAFSPFQAQSESLPLYKRPTKGTKGKEILLRSNMFKLELTDMFWYKYIVEITDVEAGRVSL